MINIIFIHLQLTGVFTSNFQPNCAIIAELENQVVGMNCKIQTLQSNLNTIVRDYSKHKSELTALYNKQTALKQQLHAANTCYLQYNAPDSHPQKILYKAHVQKIDYQYSSICNDIYDKNEIIKADEANKQRCIRDLSMANQRSNDLKSNIMSLKKR